MADPNTNFPVDPELTAIAVAYRNQDMDLIADRAMPRVPVGSTTFEYTKYGEPEDAYRLPATAVGPKGRVNRVELDGQRTPGNTEDNAIDVPLSYFDLNVASKGVSARQRATEYGAHIISLRHEIAVAGLLFDEGSYAAGYKEELVGADQLDHEDYAGNPLTLIQHGLETALMRPNLMLFGTRAWSVFRSLPAIVKAVLGNSGDSGLATREQVAKLFEVQEVLVGMGRVNVTKPGEAPEMNRVWGPHCSAIYVDRAAASSGGLTFGAAFQYGTRESRVLQSSDVGMRGGELVRTGESTRPLVVAPHAGYFFENIVSGG